MVEAAEHPHNRRQRTFVEVDGLTQPAPVPRFSRTPLPTPGSLPPKASRGFGPLLAWGIDRARLDAAVKAKGSAE